ncbi:hypothetical protein PCANC_28276 [Puccinia coronata f. sp. avenae]|uniref:Uncharacterized protein n=1 Tax=Puccinia coronata f. sp. avenae TaxID=200324 RepID=A0A2N5RWT2_9BASI|nr:hypothetical protein PCANC_28276 [Puccinia coronata f. sp. avenae]
MQERGGRESPFWSSLTWVPLGAILALGGTHWSWQSGANTTVYGWFIGLPL